MTIYEDNLAKIRELDISAHWAGEQWLKECHELNLRFRITEAYRSPQRQRQLYQIGRRGKAGEKPVTWTLQSMHTKKLAVDIYPLNCSYEDVADIAARYGITHPLTKAPIVDLAHFEFDKCKQPSFGFAAHLSPEARLKRTKARIDRMTEPQRTRARKRIEKREGVDLA